MAVAVVDGVVIDSETWVPPSLSFMRRTNLVPFVIGSAAAFAGIQALTHIGLMNGRSIAGFALLAAAHTAGWAFYNGESVRKERMSSAIQTMRARAMRIRQLREAGNTHSREYRREWSVFRDALDDAYRLDRGRNVPLRRALQGQVTFQSSGYTLST